MHAGIFVFFLIALTSLASSADSLEKKAQDFFGWLESHKTQFSQCAIQRVSDHYLLCDGTKVNHGDLAELFKLEPSALVKVLKSRGIQLEILCDTDPHALPTFKADCQTTSSRKMFKEMSALHGEYLPEEKTILIRSSALKGSLIHEYVHYLQSENKNEIFGKVYKKTKNDLKKELVQKMDQSIAEIQRLEKAGQKAAIAPKLKEFMAVSSLVQNFAPWQDFIDEREIFLLYLNFGDKFGASSDDLALAKKNMGFICKNPKLSASLPATQCPH